MVGGSRGEGVEVVGPGSGGQRIAPYAPLWLRRGGQSLALRRKVEESGRK
jgi:hypothetical protein